MRFHTWRYGEFGISLNLTLFRVGEVGNAFVLNLHSSAEVDSQNQPVIGMVRSCKAWQCAANNLPVVDGRIQNTPGLIGGMQTESCSINNESTGLWAR